MSKQRGDAFEVGDRVFVPDFGHGKILSINDREDYPYRVLVDGEKVPTWMKHIYHVNTGDITFDTSEPPPKLEVDTPVWVKVHTVDKWKPVHFSHFIGRYLYGFENGGTSHTRSKGQTLCYIRYVTENPNK